MKTLVIYSSKYGNTSKIATKIAAAISASSDVKLLLVDAVNYTDIQQADVVIVGSPTQAGRPTKNMQKFLDSLPPDALKDRRTAAFDTRLALKEHGLGLELVMKSMGFAAAHIAAGLEAKGGISVVDPEGFIVRDKEGPLKQGELDRTSEWVKKIVSAWKGL